MMLQQSPWLGIANRQLELMGRYMAELGLTPASRSRVVALSGGAEQITQITRIILTDATWPDGQTAQVEVRPGDVVLPADAIML